MFGTTSCVLSLSVPDKRTQNNDLYLKLFEGLLTDCKNVMNLLYETVDLTKICNECASSFKERTLTFESRWNDIVKNYENKYEDLVLEKSAIVPLPLDENVENLSSIFNTDVAVIPEHEATPHKAKKQKLKALKQEPIRRASRAAKDNCKKRMKTLSKNMKKEKEREKLDRLKRTNTEVVKRYLLQKKKLDKVKKEAVKRNAKRSKMKAILNDQGADVEGEFPCSLCNMTLASRDSVIIHTKKVHGRNIFKCEQPNCNFVTKTTNAKTTLENHFYDIHSSEMLYCNFPDCRGYQK